MTRFALVDRLALWDVMFYCTDHWPVYAAVIPAEKLVMSKAHTDAIERNHGRQRHWFGRFKRKSIIVSKVKEMVELTMALFARFRVNGDVSEIFTGRTAIAFELLQQHHLMDIVTGESIGTHNQHAINCSLPELVPKVVESGAVERGATVAIVTKDMFVKQLFACVLEMGLQALNLLGNGVGQGLTIGRHADIDGTGHVSPPIVKGEGLKRWERWSTGLDGSIAGDTGRRDPSVLPRRPTPETDAVSASGVSWYPP
jgi:insertion element IS1 protein InsB